MAHRGRFDFSVWDRWFLTVLFGVHDGVWSALRDALRANRREGSFRRDGAEAKLSHLSDLEDIHSHGQL